MDCWKIATNLFDGKFFDFIYQKLNLKTFEKKVFKLKVHTVFT